MTNLLWPAIGGLAFGVVGTLLVQAVAQVRQDRAWERAVEDMDRATERTAQLLQLRSGGL